MDDISGEQIKRIVDRNKELEKENQVLKNVLSSRRFVFANKTANIYNKVLPIGSFRRRFFSKVASPFKKKIRKTKLDKAAMLGKISGEYKKILVICGVGWGVPLPQRSHYLSNIFSSRDDILVIYYSPDEWPRLITQKKSNFYIISSLSLLSDINKMNSTKKFLFINNVFEIPLGDIMSLKKNGFKIIYDCIDELDEVLSNGAMVEQKEVLRALPSLRPEFVFAVSRRLAQQMKEIMPQKKIFVFKNGVNVDSFDYRNFLGNKVPSDLRKRNLDNKQIVGYYGAIAPWLDFDLIHTVAKKNPNLLFVFIGADYGGALEKLDLNLDNVCYLGVKEQTELASYAACFDCAIIPFLPGEIARSTSPIKLYEYMAAGVPVVCTKDLEECLGYEYVYVAKDDDDFEKKLLKCLKLHKKFDVKDELLRQANENTWEKIAFEMLKVIGLEKTSGE